MQAQLFWAVDAPISLKHRAISSISCVFVCIALFFLSCLEIEEWSSEIQQQILFQLHRNEAITE